MESFGSPYSYSIAQQIMKIQYFLNKALWFFAGFEFCNLAYKPNIFNLTSFIVIAAVALFQALKEGNNEEN